MAQRCTAAIVAVRSLPSSPAIDYAPRLMLLGSRILITGGSGFLGSHVVDQLRARGVSPSQITIPRPREDDLTDAAATRVLFDRARPEVVLHLAARVGGIGANRRNPGTFFRDNMAMGLNVLEEARRAG